MKRYFLNSISIALLFSFTAHAQPQWQREFEAIVNGDTLSGAYAGDWQVVDLN